MNPLNIKRISLPIIIDQFPLNDQYLKIYTEGRPDIIQNTDIFFENCRSLMLPPEYKFFNLFKENEIIKPETILICPIYLEIFERCNQPVLKVIEFLSKKFFPNRIIFQWNHDIDFADKYSEASNFENAYIINFNTSKPLKNDIIVPFWAINTDFIPQNKSIFACFLGSINNSLRNNLVNTIYRKENYHYISGVPLKDFLPRCIFSFCPKGQGLNSYRFYECFHLNTIPVLIADKSFLPFQDKINYNEICVRIPESKATDFEFIDKTLKNVDSEKMLQSINDKKINFTLYGVQTEIYNKLCQN